MQLGDATVMMETCSGENIVADTAQNGGGGEEKGREIGGEEDDKMNININGGGGNRWPRQETLALLKIRSDMDGVFRDSSLKGPLWEEVSRKLAELGYHRSSKKCKEKFENVYKYHKRTKEGRSGKSEGKTYRFFDQLQALEKQLTFSSYHPKPQPNNNTLSSPTTNPNETTQTISYVTTTVPSTNPTTFVSPSPQPNNNNVPNSLPNMNNLFSTTTTSTSSSTASDEDLEEKYRKKRKWKDYFRRLTRQVLAKQEEMQKKFLEAIDKREKEHIAQQDALRIQEMDRINKEHELLIQERSSAAQKNAAVIAFLQKLSGQPPPQPPPAPELSPCQTALASQVQTQQLVIPNNNIVEFQNLNNGYKSGNGGASPSPSRWPKSEVHALIRIRTSLEPKYQENGPKAPLWEDISAAMKRQGYNRNAKRCKEKWENINKYYKKMKESNKQRRDDSKTCPYFNELEAIYKEKNKTQNLFGSNSFHSMKSNETMEPLMVQPEQQWRPPTTFEEGAVVKKNVDEAKEEDDNGDVDDEEDENMDEYEDGDSMEEDEGGVSSRYEVVTTNKLSSMDTVV